MTPDGFSGYDPDPGYGEGCYRRSIRLRNAPGIVTGELEDTHHGMRLVLEHDNTQITATSALFPRVPTSLCDGAGEPLRQLVGMPLALATGDILRRIDRRLQCTHLLDLALLAVAHASRRQVERRFDITIPDAPSGTGWAEVTLDGTLLHHWIVSDGMIRSPEALAGQPVLSGLLGKLADLFAGDMLEGAAVLQKGYLVSRARRCRMDGAVGKPIIGNTHLHGVCHAYSSPRLAEASHLASARDFTTRADRLLAYDP